MRFLDLFLWMQLGKIALYVFYGLVIMLLERLSYGVMLLGSFIFPVGLLDSIRHQWFRNVPRLLRGFRDPHVSPDMNYTTPQLCTSRGYPCEEHFVRTRDGFFIGLHRIPHNRDEQRQREHDDFLLLQARRERMPCSHTGGGVAPHCHPPHGHHGPLRDDADIDLRTARGPLRSLPLPLPVRRCTPRHADAEGLSASAPAAERIGSGDSENLADRKHVLGDSSDHSEPDDAEVQRCGAYVYVHSNGLCSPSAGTRAPVPHAGAPLAPALSPSAGARSQPEQLPVRCPSSAPPAVRARPVVFIMHGFLQSSESFVSADRNLPFTLAEAGFDVWLGNCRGNKYSCKHERLDPESPEYWDFCLDHSAQIDMPAVIDYILGLTGQPSLSYIGFSQGTAIGFAAFSINQTLARRVNLFVAMAPSTNLKGFSNKIINALTRSSPHIVFLVLGRRRLLPSTIFWQQLLSVKALVRVIDMCVGFLFGWDMRNVHPKDKGHHYAHIYSYSSVKSVVQWFQFMGTGRFQMYDDHRWRFQNSRTYIPPCYPVGQIVCPIALFYGGRDHLPDTGKLLNALPRDVFVHEEASYEHMDFMYARSAVKRIYPQIVKLCRSAAACAPQLQPQPQPQPQHIEDQELPLPSSASAPCGAGALSPSLLLAGSQLSVSVPEDMYTPPSHRTHALYPEAVCASDPRCAAGPLAAHGSPPLVSLSPVSGRRRLHWPLMHPLSPRLSGSLCFPLAPPGTSSQTQAQTQTHTETRTHDKPSALLAVSAATADAYENAPVLHL